jgi:hypothetical protein
MPMGVRNSASGRFGSIRKTWIAARTASSPHSAGSRRGTAAAEKVRSPSSVACSRSPLPSGVRLTLKSKPESPLPRNEAATCSPLPPCGGGIGRGSTLKTRGSPPSARAKMHERAPHKGGAGNKAHLSANPPSAGQGTGCANASWRLPLSNLPELKGPPCLPATPR